MSPNQFKISVTFLEPVNKFFIANTNIAYLNAFFQDDAANGIPLYEGIIRCCLRM